MFHIQLFGTPSTAYNDQPWNIQRRAVRSMLYFLAASGQPVSRSRLALLFWPDASESEARRHLRDSLGKLRKSLPDPSLIQATQQTISLDFERVQVDVVTFEGLLTQAGNAVWTHPGTTPLPGTVYVALTQAVGLWREPGFLAGVDIGVSFELDEWLTTANHSFEREYLIVLRRLVHHELATANLDKAVHWLYQALRTDLTNEEFNTLLVKTLIETGQRAEARKHLDHIHETGIVDLYVENLRVLVEQTQSKADTSLLDDQIWLLRPSLEAPYIGQEHAFNQLERTYYNGSGVIVYGEAGAGKTRLVQEFFYQLSSRPRLLLASCYSHEMDIPFYPWIELLRHHVQREEWMQLPAAWASLLTIFIPELTAWRSDLQPLPKLSSKRARLNLFEAVRQLLLVASRDRPVLLFLDDAHWADESSFDLLVYLLEHTHFAPANQMLILAARIEEPGPALARFLRVYPRQGLEQVYLSRLNETEIRDLVYHVLGKWPPQEFIAQLTRDSGGNPFFILETLQAILDSSTSRDLQTITNLPMPRSVHHLIQNRLQRLSTEAQEILQMAAVLGNRFGSITLEQASAFPTEKYIQALDELQTACLIVEMREAKQLEFAFVHEKFRESLLQGLTTLRAKLLHQKAARALEVVYNGGTEEVAAILAQHYEEAGVFSLAFDYWVQAATNAYRLTAVKEARNAFGRAKKLITLASDLKDEQIYELYTRWSDLGFNLDDPTEIIYLNQEFLEFGHARNSDLLIGAALDGLGDAEFARNNFTDGLKYTESAIPYLEKTGNTYELLNSRIHRGVFLYMMGNMRQAKQELEQTLAQIPEKPDHKLLGLSCNLHYQLGILETLMGWPVKGQKYLLHSIEHKRCAQWPMDYIGNYTALGLNYYIMGEYTSGREASCMAMELAERQEYWRMLGYSSAYAAINEQELGFLGNAWEHAQQAIEIGKTYAHIEIASLGYRALGDMYVRLYDFEDAIKMYQKGFEIGGEHFAALDNLFRSGYAQAMLGLPDGAANTEQVITITRQMELGAVSIFAENARYGFMLEKHPEKLIDQELLVFRHEADLRSVKFVTSFIDIVRARVKLLTQDIHSAVSLLEQAVQESGEIANPWLEMRALNCLISTLSQLGHPIDELQARILTLARKIDKHIGKSPLEQIWQAYRECLLTVNS